MKNQKELIQIAAGSPITVLLYGESGVGKEVAARTLHKNSPRSSMPFIALNCGALAQNLMESTLEGSVKGAYTGSVAERMGVVRAANGGTLFLDEIGELPYECQSKMLRILQEHTVLPIGATKAIPVDFRLICATNRDLKADVRCGRFREDLFFRLNVFPIRIPPLRERVDFDCIAKSVWDDILHEEGAFTGYRRILTDCEIDTLRRYKWPGNIRQLKNVLQRYALLSHHHINLDEILADEYKCAEMCHFAPKPGRIDIDEALQKYRGNKARAARALGISRGSLYYQMKKAEIRESAGA